MLTTILSFLVVIGVVVTLHEFGHFLAARLTGMRVNKFSIGFPPKIWSKKFGATEFQICWIPLGGFVHIAGMVDESLDETVTGAPDEFMSKNPLQKTFVLSAGVLMNYVTAVVLITVITIGIGIPEPAGTIVGQIIPERPAANAGVLVDDVIRAVDGSPTVDWDDVVKGISGAGDTVVLTLERAGGETVDVVIPTEANSSGGVTRRVVGIAPKAEYRPAKLTEAISAGGIFCWNTTRGIIAFLGDLFSGRGDLKDVAGPLGVAMLSGESARQGADMFLYFIAYVSVSIGFLNILPFPVLDGGHIFYVLIEAAIRRPIPSKLKLYIQQAGMVVLLLFFLLVSYQDIVRIFFN